MGSANDFRDKSQVFLEYLKSVGDIDDACIMASLDPRTIEKWRKQYKDFDHAVDQAFEQFRDTLPIVLKNEARRQLANAVFGRNAVVNTRITNRYDANGELIDRTEVVETIAQGAQRWAIERVLDDKQIPKIESALKVLAEAGFLPKTLTERTLAVLEDKQDSIQKIFTEYYPDTQTETQKGLSESIVNQIRQEILGDGELPEMETIDIEVSNND